MIDIGAVLKAFIYLLSSSLLYPVLFLLSALALVIIVYVGTFAAEWLERVRLEPCPPQKVPTLMKSGKPARAFSHRVNRYIQALHQTIGGFYAGEIAVENLLQDTTLRLWKSMDRLRILVRAAPSLGLIGTLIPMGSGLAALGQGDMTQLTTNLVIAFTTTVVGLAVGTLAFVMYTVRRRWIEEDIKNMEMATETVMKDLGRRSDEIRSAAAN